MLQVILSAWLQILVIFAERSVPSLRRDSIVTILGMLAAYLDPVCDVRYYVVMRSDQL